jgi:alkylated DNA repair dioxygenase AlkB
VKKILKDKDKPLVDLEVEFVCAGNPWERQDLEPEESYAFLLTLMNEVPNKSIRGLYNHLEATGKGRYSYEELRRLANKFHWTERAWAYDRSLGEQIKGRNEEALAKIQTEMEKFAQTLIEKNHELTKATDPEAVMMNFAGLLASAKASLPAQIATVYKSLVGDKLKMEVEGKFDHRVAAAVAEWAKDT